MEVGARAEAGAGNGVRVGVSDDQVGFEGPQRSDERWSLWA